MTFVRAISWSLASEITAKAIQPVIFLVLARLLTPQDFGVVASVMIVISFSQVFWEAGMGKALVQSTDNAEKVANVAFWANLCLATAAALILTFLADSIAQNIFGDARIGSVIRVLAISLILGALTSVHTALLQKAMNFKRLFFVRIAGVVIPGICSIPLALAGWAYWAIVIGTISGQIGQLIMLWWGRSFTPTISIDLKVARRVFNFSAWVFISGLLSWFYTWADSLIVGFYLGGRDLGLYRTGSILVFMIFGAFFAPLLPVIYSQFSKVNGRGLSVAPLMMSATRIVALTAIPLGFLLFASSDVLARILFGQQWEGINFVIGMMALMVGFSTVVSLNGEAYRAIGKPYLETAVTGGMLGVYITAYLVSAQFGFASFVYTRVGLALVALLVHLVLAAYVGILNLNQIVPSVLLAVLCGATSVAVFKLLTYANWLNAIPDFLYAALAASASIALLALTQRKTIKSDVLMLWRAV